MKSFHDMIADDLLDVVLNPDEFGKECTLNGQTVPYADVSLFDETDGSNSVTIDRDIMVRSRDISHQPRSRDVLLIDGERWIVRAVRPSLEFYTITIGRQV